MTSTEDAPRAAAPRWFQRVLPVTALALALVGLAVVLLPGLREHVALSASHRPQEYVELYFARTAAGTQLVCTSADETVRVSFAVTSHLEHDDELAYDISVGDARQTGSVAVEPGETVEVTREVARSAGGGYDVVVRLPGIDQQLLAHCPGAGS